MPLYPGAPLVWANLQFTDDNGEPLSSGLVYSYEAGTDTPLYLYTDVDLFIPFSNPIELDADGRPGGPVFMLPQGYKLLVVPEGGSVDSPLYTLDNLEDVGQVFAENVGVFWSEGGKDQVSGYEVQTDDHLVTMDSTGGADPCLVNLPPCTDATQDVTIKNMGTVALSIVPDGADTIEGIAGAYAVAASATPLFRSVTLRPDGGSAWYVVASVGV